MTERKCIIASRFRFVNDSLKEIIKSFCPDMDFVTVNSVEGILSNLCPEQEQFIVIDRYIFGLFIEEEFKKIVSIHPTIKVFCIMDDVCERYFGLRLMRCGCNCIIYYLGEDTTFIDQLRSAFEGRKVIPDNIREALEKREYLMMPDCVGSLTKREIEVLALMVNGKSIKQICLNLKLAHGTVASLRSRIMKKLGVSNSFETIRIASSYGYTYARSFECF